MNRRRTIGWGALLALAIVLCVNWAAQPSLSSAPVLRVFLFAGLGLCGAGLTFWAPNKSLLIAAAVLLRLILLPAPVSDDVHRYLWEGKLIRHGHSPYAQTADAAALAHLRDSQWERMNHRDRPTAYPPLAELAFAAVGAIAYHPLALKLAFILSDLATLLLILSLLRSRSLPMHYAGWYAFNPITLIGIAAEAHYDTLFVFALTAFWWAAERKQPALAWLALAASVQFKLISVLLAPFYFRRQTARSAWLFPALLALPGLAFLHTLPELLHGVTAFAGQGQFNDAPHLLLSQILPRLPIFLFLFLYLLIFFQQFRDRLTLTAASYWTLGALIIFSPIVHFWYLLWILPLVALHPSVSWLVFCLTQAGYFLAWQTETEQGWWGLPLPIVFAMWTPFLVCLAYQGAFGNSQRKDHRQDANATGGN